ncbi:MAG: hypothetical protein OXF88_23335 [Rhodobacteraceae bacterium]|nr:hypothetical protein [Paracoccaceae bacterium]MCY4137856.1 hypothetical protein [Paracoccaceae bacterium]
MSITGAYQHGLDDNYISELRRVPHKPVSDGRRKTRAETMDALTMAGFPEYMDLLWQV